MKHLYFKTHRLHFDKCGKIFGYKFSLVVFSKFTYLFAGIMWQCLPWVIKPQFWCLIHSFLVAGFDTGATDDAVLHFCSFFTLLCFARLKIHRVKCENMGSLRNLRMSQISVKLLLLAWGWLWKRKIKLNLIVYHVISFVVFLSNFMYIST